MDIQIIFHPNFIGIPKENSWKTPSIEIFFLNKKKEMEKSWEELIAETTVNDIIREEKRNRTLIRLHYNTNLRDALHVPFLNLTSNLWFRF